MKRDDGGWKRWGLRVVFFFCFFLLSSNANHLSSVYKTTRRVVILFCFFVQVFFLFWGGRAGPIPLDAPSPKPKLNFVFFPPLHSGMLNIDI